MATLATALAFSRAQAQTDTNGLTDTNGIIFANEALLDFRRRLTAAGVDAAQVQEAYASATAGVGTYAYPSDLYFLKAIEANYANTNAQDYRTATQVDVSNISGQASFSWLRQNADPNFPQFDDRGDWFEIFPTPTAGNNLTNMFRIFYFLAPTEYTATSDTIAYPEKLDYRILGWRIAASYLLSLGKIIEADTFNAKYNERVEQLIATLGRGSQQPVQATAIPLTGFEY